MIRKNFSEFFAGIGLMRMGLEQAGWQVAFANDIDPVKRRIYEGHFSEEKHFLLEDIHKLSESQVPDSSLATASFPCTDLSLAGRRGGLAGPQSSAFWGFINLLKEKGDTKPRIVLLENVSGFLSSNKGKDFKEALLALNNLGYAVDAMIINASNFVPQSRERLFIIGKLKKNSAKVIKPSAPAFESPVRPAKLASFIFENSDINWDICDLPPLPERTAVLSDIIEPVPDKSKIWWLQERTDYLFNQMSEKHKAIINKHIQSNKIFYGTVFRRVRNGKCMAELRFDGIAGCLRTPKGGSAKQILVRFGKGKISARLLTPSECAKLMGAEGFTISGTLDQALFGFGDAVCVPVIKWIGENYLNRVFSEMYFKNEHSGYEQISKAV